MNLCFYMPSAFPGANASLKLEEKQRDATRASMIHIIRLRVVPTDGDAVPMREKIFLLLKVIIGLSSRRVPKFHRIFSPHVFRHTRCYAMCVGSSNSWSSSWRRFQHWLPFDQLNNIFPKMLFYLRLQKSKLPLGELRLQFLPNCCISRREKPPPAKAMAWIPSSRNSASLLTITLKNSKK